jgi:hypothetical protein
MIARQVMGGCQSVYRVEKTACDRGTGESDKRGCDGTLKTGIRGRRLSLKHFKAKPFFIWVEPYRVVRVWKFGLCLYMIAKVHKYDEWNSVVIARKCFSWKSWRIWLYRVHLECVFVAFVNQKVDRVPRPKSPPPDKV